MVDVRLLDSKSFKGSAAHNTSEAFLVISAA